LTICWDADKIVVFVCSGSWFKFKSNKRLILLISLGPILYSQVKKNLFLQCCWVKINPDLMIWLVTNSKAAFWNLEDFHVLTKPKKMTFKLTFSLISILKGLK
jgi:hypothetical protein